MSEFENIYDRIQTIEGRLKALEEFRSSLSVDASGALCPSPMKAMAATKCPNCGSEDIRAGTNELWCCHCVHWWPNTTDGRDQTAEKIGGLERELGSLMEKLRIEKERRGAAEAYGIEQNERAVAAERERDAALAAAETHRHSHDTLERLRKGESINGMVLRNPCEHHVRMRRDAEAERDALAAKVGGLTHDNDVLKKQVAQLREVETLNGKLLSEADANVADLERRLTAKKFAEGLTDGE